MAVRCVYVIFFAVKYSATGKKNDERRGGWAMYYIQHTPGNGFLKYFHQRLLLFTTFPTLCGLEGGTFRVPVFVAVPVVGPTSLGHRPLY